MNQSNVFLQRFENMSDLISYMILWSTKCTDYERIEKHELIFVYFLVVDGIALF